jgi:hypothetical protein
MISFPSDLDTAIAQARTATRAALEAGHTRLQVEILIPELKLQPVAEQFIQEFADLGSQLRIFFPDPGSAALARRDWGETPYAVRGIRDMKAQIQPEESLFIFVEPSAVEVDEVEKLCEEASSRPVIFLNPVLEDLMNVGVGYTSRKMKDRFAKTIASCYYLKPLDQGALFYCYPQSWQVWLEQANGTYHLEAEFPSKPDSETLERLFSGSPEPENSAPQPQPGLLAGLQRLLRF